MFRLFLICFLVIISLFDLDFAAKLNNQFVLKRLHQCDGMDNLLFKLVNTSIIASKKSQYIFSGIVTVDPAVLSDLKGYTCV